MNQNNCVMGNEVSVFSPPRVAAQVALSSGVAAFSTKLLGGDIKTEVMLSGGIALSSAVINYQMFGNGLQLNKSALSALPQFAALPILFGWPIVLFAILHHHYGMPHTFLATTINAFTLGADMSAFWFLMSSPGGIQFQRGLGIEPKFTSKKQ